VEQKETKAKAEKMTAHLLMTTAEVMQETRMGRTTIWRKISCGEMPAPIGSPKRFRRSDIEYWIENGMKSAKTTRALKAAEGK
jgi:predicted DNA-binding transcriptional regulator AlpA